MDIDHAAGKCALGKERMITKMRIINSTMYQLRECFIEYKNCFIKYGKQFFILLGIYLLAFCSIFRANFTYMDDLGRTYAGYHGWLDWSRYGTEILSTILHMDWHLTDISPLPQIIACAIMAASGILLLAVFGNGGEIKLFHIAAASLTALAPYFLGMISYKFDSPYMAFSFLVCILPFLFREKATPVYMAVSIVCLIAMCVTYQPSSGVYPLTALFLFMRGLILPEEADLPGEDSRNLTGGGIKENLKFIGISALCYVVSLLFFWIFLMRSNDVSIIPLSKMLSSAADKYRTYYRIIFHDYTKVWIILLTAVVIIFLYSVCRNARINRILAFAIGIFTVFAGSVLCFGANLFISRDKYDARAMYGINFFITMLAVFISFYAGHWIFKMAYTVLAWSFAVFALTYGNALAVQKDYMDYRTELLAGDLNDLEIMNTDEEKYIRITGDIGYSPVIRNMAVDYPILDRETYSSGDRLIGTGLGEGIWEEYYFYCYLDIPGIEGSADQECYRDLPVIKDTMYHTIRGDGNYILIELKE